MEYTIKKERIPRQPYLAIRETVSIKGIGELMGPLYGELYGWLGRNGVTPTGPAWTRYLAVGPEDCELELGVPIAAQVPGDARVAGGVMPECEVISTLYVGPFEDMGAAYSAMAAWLSEHSAVVSGAPWEVYLTDPAQEPDPAKWQTLIYFPISSS